VQEELQLLSNECQNEVTCSNEEHFPLKQTGTLDETWKTIGFVDKWDAEIVTVHLSEGGFVSKISLYIYEGFLSNKYHKRNDKAEKKNADWCDVR
jgi:hypothetical protein